MQATDSRGLGVRETVRKRYSCEWRIPSVNRAVHSVCVSETVEGAGECVCVRDGVDKVPVMLDNYFKT